MLNLQVDVHQNTVSWNRRTVRFRRTHSALFLEQLLVNGLRAMTMSLTDLQSAAQAAWQLAPVDRSANPFGRQQIARLVQELEAFFLDNPELGLTFERVNRQMTVGPWRITVTTPISMTTSQLVTKGPKQEWTYPALVDGVEVDSLRELLAQWLTFEGFAVYGEHGPALDMIPDAALMTTVTVEAQAVLQLRRVYFLRRLSQYDKALELVTNLQQSATSLKDTRLPGQLLLTLARTEYERDPASRWRQAQAVLAKPPTIVAPCAMTQAEWHNLQALCSRRAALEAFEAGDRALAIAQHESAIGHFQSALYFALSLQSWDRVHAFIDNFCYHLQKMYEYQVVPIQEVLDWYTLALACADKLDSGHDDAWDLIFFAEFYLDHAEQIIQSQNVFSHRSSLLHDRYSPGRQDFWDGALSRARSIGGLRQLAITLILYLRWALVHQQTLTGTVSVWSLKLDLNRLLEQNPELAQQLCEDGYDGWLQRVTLK